MPCLVLFSKIQDVISRLLKSLYIPKIHITDVIEILIITLLIYVFLNWIKTTRAYNLLKGMVMIFGFLLIANFLQMNTILWIARTIGPSAITALIIIFHPELRKALEKIGQQRFLSGFLTLDPNRDSGEFYSDATINEIVRAEGI